MIPTLPPSGVVSAALARTSFAHYVALTCGHELHAWQRIVCDRLQRLKHETGQRILIHGPPQFGKSILVSKRFPAWWLGHKPEGRVVLAAYAKNHALGLALAMRAASESELHRRAFPRFKWESWNADAGGSLSQRVAKRDGQPSLRAVGLESGFTGTGCDLLIIDDPYASADDARSEAVNGSVWRWWSETALPRLNDRTNVVVMFHRYHPEDLAGRLMREGAGGAFGWECLRFPALADDNQEGDDPTGRQPGEPLSPIRSAEFLHRLKDLDPIMFAGQFQGRPIAEESRLFRESDFQVVDEVPDLVEWVRGWDLASSIRESADYSASVKVGFDPAGNVYVADVWRARLESPDLRAWIKTTALGDGPGTHQCIESKSVGLAMVQECVRDRGLRSIVFRGIEPKGDKRQRALAWASRARAGKVFLLRRPWTSAFLAECLAFTGLEPGRSASASGSHDDQIDAMSVAYHAGYDRENRYSIEKPTFKSPYRPTEFR